MSRVPADGIPAASASASSSSSPPPEVDEETGRGQLVGVTGDDRPVGTHERPDRVCGSDLGRLVKDDDVEAPLAGSSCETTSGDMAQHGLSAPRTFGAAWNSCRTGRWPRLRRAWCSMTSDSLGYASRTRVAFSATARRTRDRGAVDVSPVSGPELGDSTAVGLAVEGADPRVGDRHGIQDR